MKVVGKVTQVEQITQITQIAKVAQVAQVGHELERAVRPLVAGARAGRLDRSADRAAMSTRAVPAREVNYLAPCVSSEYPPSELPLSTLSYLL